jgi:hypothetical protein
MAVQTIDAQVRELEQTLGHQLLEGEFEQRLGELALHHLDPVLAGQAAPRNPNLRLSSERLVESPIEWCGPARLVRKTERDRFPQLHTRREATFKP